MIRIIKCLFPRHEKEATPNARERLRITMERAGIEPPKDEAFLKLVFSEAYRGTEDFRPLGDNDKHHVASMIMYEVYGPGVAFKARQFAHDAERARLTQEEMGKVFIRIWGRTRA